MEAAVGLFGRFFARARAMSRATSLPAHCALPGVALALCVLVPYLGKAYTIDDTLFLRQAEHAARDALHPAAFDYYWDYASGGSDSLERLSSYMPSGPVMAWLLLPAVRLTHGEMLAHAMQLVLFMAAIVATASTGLRLGLGESAARRAAVLLAASPAVLGMSSTCMPDTAAMAFGVIGIERALAWRESRRLTAAIATVAMLSAAALSRNHAWLLLGLALLFTIGARPASGSAARFSGVVAAVPALVAIGVTWAVLRLTRDPATGADAVTSVTNFHPTFRATNAFALLTSYALTLPFGFGMVLTRMVPLLRGRALYFAVPTATALSFLCDVHDWLLVAAAASGLTALLDTLGAAAFSPASRRFPSAWRRWGDDVALTLWLLAPLPIIYYVHLPAKYLLPSAPAAALLLAAALSARGQIVRGALVTLLAAGGCVLGTLIVKADAAMAGLGRRAAAELVAPAVAKGERVWFAGHWGFQWYMEHAGARPLLGGTGVRSGDLIVESSQVHGLAFDRIARSLVRIENEPSPGGRIMSGGAGFYSNFWGYYPWVWSTASDLRIALWRVR